jgi:hypothetical protein
MKTAASEIFLSSPPTPRPTSSTPAMDTVLPPKPHQLRLTQTFNSVTNLPNYALDSARHFAGSLTWGPALSIARSAATSLLHRIVIGQLTIRDGEKLLVFGPGGNGPSAVLQVENESFWVRLFLFADMVRFSLEPVPQRA